MKIIFSPSKTMKNKKINFSRNKEINFLNKTNFLIEKLKKLSLDEIEKKFKLKGKLLEETYNNIQNFDSLDFQNAIALYDGVTFRQLELEKYSEYNLEFLSENLFIFSALYGIISPNTKIKPYRLDMTINFFEENLYKFWSEEINNFLNEYSNETFINLASKEFSKIMDYRKFKIIDIEFRQNIDGKIKNISTEAKKARGMLLNYIIKNSIADIERIKEFSEEGYKFSPENSNETQIFFIK